MRLRKQIRGSAMKGLTAQNCIWRPMTRTLVVAAVSIVPAAAAAQQADSATPPAPSTTARPEPAKDSDSSFDANIGAALASDYNYRGYTLSDHRPSVSTNIEATYKSFFLGTNAASVQIPMLSQLQMTNYAGLRPVFGSLTVEMGIAYFSYPGSVIDTSYPEVYIAPSYAITAKLKVGLSAYYAPNYSRTGAWETTTRSTPNTHSIRECRCPASSAIKASAPPRHADCRCLQNSGLCLLEFWRVLHLQGFDVRPAILRRRCRSKAASS